jgi:porphobilinogen deaminase
VEAERAFLSALGGNCQLPAGALALFSQRPNEAALPETAESWRQAPAEAGKDGACLTLYGFLADLSGKKILRESLSGNASSREQAARLGTELARRIRKAGGDRILAGIAKPCST